MTGCWRGSRPCFMLSALVYLALPTPCDAYDSYDNYFICVPPQVGDLWAYRRTIVLGNETRIETVTVSVAGTEQVGDQEYYQVYSTDTDIYSRGRDRRSEDAALYRASDDGAIWRYYRGGERLHFDLWRVGTDQEGEIRYEGVFFGGSTEDYEDRHGVHKLELVRRGPFEMVVSDSLYSGVFEFWIEEECCTEFYVYLYVHPEIGVLKKATYTLEYSDVWKLISFNRKSNVPSVVREVTWGTVKKRHMSERLR